MHNSMDRPVPPLVSDASVDSGKRLPISSAGGHEFSSHESYVARLHDTPHYISTGSLLPKIFIVKILPNHCALSVSQLIACLIDG